MTVAGSYHPYLVVLSLSLGCLASYTALDLAGRITGSRRRIRLLWLATAALVMGGGIWSMHFVGMLAFVMPMRVGYDIDLTVLSLLVAVAVTGFCFFMIGTRGAGEREFVLGGIVLGAGVVAMHYTGMAAMRMPAGIRYDPVLVTLSIVIAIAASVTALWLAFRTAVSWQRPLSAVIMGAAISGMHYTAMAAATFVADPAMDGARDRSALAQTDLAVAIAAITVIILSLALAAAAVDRKLAQRSREVDDQSRQLRAARDELMAVYEQGLYASHCSLDGTIVHANRACVEDLGFARPDIVGRPLWAAPWWPLPESRHWARGTFARAAAGTPFRGEVNYAVADGTVHVADIAFVPIKDEAGDVVSVFVPGMDVTDRARQYRATFENAGVGIAHLSPDIRWLQVNRRFADIVGYAPDELVAMSVQDITHPDDLASSAAEVERLRSGAAESYEIEKRYVRKDGTPVWVHITGTAVRRNDGSVDHFVSVIQDISQRRHAEEQVRLLVREMNHRGKNILALVQAVARQTLTSDPAHFMERFSDRIQAIAANQDLLAGTSWKGVDAGDLVAAQLAHFSDLIGTRITVRGPGLRLNGAAAQAIGMAVHELATNASKYGALSTGAGRVDVSWRTDGDRFVMHWSERGGPPVTPPDRAGFGSTVTGAMAEQALGGMVEHAYDTAGVSWQLTCPAAAALETPADAAAGGAAAPAVARPPAAGAVTVRTG